MTRDEIEVGRCYLTRIGKRKLAVRILAVRRDDLGRLRYDALVLRNGLTIAFRTGRRLLGPAPAG